MNAYDSPTFANDNGILSEVLAIRLELDKSQGLAKVFMMMASYPNNLPCRSEVVVPFKASCKVFCRTGKLIHKTHFY